MTRWHSTSSGRTNLEQTGHLIPLKDTRCTGSEWAANTRPNGVPSGELEPDSAGDSGLCEGAGMLSTLERLRARSRGSPPLVETGDSRDASVRLSPD